jgi:hypothetical protein
MPHVHLLTLVRVAHTTAQRAKRQHRRVGGSVGVGGASEHALPPASLLR